MKFWNNKKDSNFNLKFKTAIKIDYNTKNVQQMSLIPKKKETKRRICEKIKSKFEFKNGNSINVATFGIGKLKMKGKLNF